MLRPVALSIVLSLLSLLSLAGQGAPKLAPGARVRLTTSWSALPLVGTVVAVDGDSVRIRPEDPALFPDHPTSVAIARSSIRGLEVAVKGHSNAGKGALIGLSIGVIGGAAGGAAGCQPDPNGFNVVGPGPCAAAGALIFGALGAGLGALIGSSGRSEHWERVALEHAPH
jgi:hypothetical protein